MTRINEELGRPMSAQDFIHTSNFILVDKKKRIRGVYDGTDDDEIQRLIHDIKNLRTEQ